MQDTYNHSGIERSAQAHWTASNAYRVENHDNPNKPLGKYYACSMLPYPSGKLHMGHVRNYTINDMLTRYLRMKGYNVLMPMGWDAFGLPAENAAMKNAVPPAQWTWDNIAYMKQQMQSLGLAIDWSREVATCSPDYYKWNQWLFLKMLEKGIAYRKTQVVNWDPIDQTVLANEQVIDGKGWRTGAVVEKREIPGYYLKITAYAEQLLGHVKDGLPGWPERVKLMQENWIGKSVGVRFAFTHTIADAAGQLIGDGRMYVFTTRADTIMGVTFCAVAPEHPLAVHAALGNAQLAAFIEQCKCGGTTEAELATQEKKGQATGLFVSHPLTGEPIGVWVGNYVLMSYGDGAVMGVPAHDERDFEFANKYGLPIKQVVSTTSKQVQKEKRMADNTRAADTEYAQARVQAVALDDVFDAKKWCDWYGDKHQGVVVNSGKYNGLAFKAAVDAVAADLMAAGLGEKKTTWRLRDWGVSRQRYWGTPIPIIHCPQHGAVPVPEKDLPVVLPQDCVPDGSGNPLHKHPGFHAGVVCPVCGQPSRRETDTMDTFVDSSWYYMRYCDPKNDQAMVGEGARYWLPMDQYIGGIEHAILHLLYARFWTKVMHDLALIAVEEPFTKLLTQGMVLNHIYSRKTGADGKGGVEYFWPHEVEDIANGAGKVLTARRKTDGLVVDYNGVGTMSKSKNNGVDPQELIEKYGADTARLYTMFTAPPEATLEWSEAGVEGSYRFLRRVWSFGKKFSTINSIANNPLFDCRSAVFDPQTKALRREVHTLLKQVDYDYQRMQYNTVVSGAMKLLNTLEREAQALALALTVPKPAPALASASLDAGTPSASARTNTQCAMAAALREGLGILLRCLYPCAPHLTHALWAELGFGAQHGDLLDAAWPEVDAAALQKDEVELMLQINGKLRGALTVAAGANTAVIEAAALASDAYARQASGAAPKKIIVVPGRLVNIVL